MPVAEGYNVYLGTTDRKERVQLSNIPERTHPTVTVNGPTTTIQTVVSLSKFARTNYDIFWERLDSEPPCTVWCEVLSVRPGDPAVHKKSGLQPRILEAVTWMSADNPLSQQRSTLEINLTQRQNGRLRCPKAARGVNRSRFDEGHLLLQLYEATQISIVPDPNKEGYEQVTVDYVLDHKTPSIVFRFDFVTASTTVAGEDEDTPSPESEPASGKTTLDNGTPQKRLRDRKKQSYRQIAGLKYHLDDETCGTATKNPPSRSRPTAARRSSHLDASSQSIHPELSELSENKEPSLASNSDDTDTELQLAAELYAGQKAFKEMRKVNNALKRQHIELYKEATRGLEEDNELLEKNTNILQQILDAQKRRKKDVLLLDVDDELRRES